MTHQRDATPCSRMRSLSRRRPLTPPCVCCVVCSSLQCHKCQPTGGDAQTHKDRCTHLECVNWRKRHAEGSAGGARKNCLDENRKLNALEESNDTGIGSRVTEAREWALEESGEQTCIEARKLAVRPES